MLEQVLNKIDPDIEWAKEVRAYCTRYLKLMMGYDILVVQVDQEKIKPHFQKMEDGMSDEITTDFMIFVA